MTSRTWPMLTNLRSLQDLAVTAIDEIWFQRKPNSKHQNNNDHLADPHAKRQLRSKCSIITRVAGGTREKSSPMEEMVRAVCIKFPENVDDPKANSAIDHIQVQHEGLERSSRPPCFCRTAQRHRRHLDGDAGRVPWDNYFGALQCLCVHLLISDFHCPHQNAINSVKAVYILLLADHRMLTIDRAKELLPYLQSTTTVSGLLLFATRRLTMCLCPG